MVADEVAAPVAPPAPETGPTPTRGQFAAYEAMAEYFNAHLFGGQLPPVLLNFGRRGRRSRGFFAPDRWEQGAATTHEISLNPEFLATRSPIEVAATLVHELCRLWQQRFGKPSRAGYHNRQWAAKMKAVGLLPSDTGQPGGKETGQRMSHAVLPGAPFARAFAAMPAEYLLPWTSPVATRAGRSARSDKVTYTCPGCRAKVWGKPGLLLRCGRCELTLAAQALAR